MIDLQATLQEQLLDISVAEWVAQVPGDGLYDEWRLVVPAFKVGIGALFQLGARSGHQPTAQQRTFNFG